MNRQSGKLAVIGLQQSFLKTVLDQVTPKNCRFILGRRENLVFNMKALFKRSCPQRILVVNDMKINIRYIILSTIYELFDHFAIFLGFKA